MQITSVGLQWVGHKAVYDQSNGFVVVAVSGFGDSIVKPHHVFDGDSSDSFTGPSLVILADHIEDQVAESTGET